MRPYLVVIIHVRQQYMTEVSLRCFKDASDCRCDHLATSKILFQIVGEASRLDDQSISRLLDSHIGEVNGKDRRKRDAASSDRGQNQAMP